MKIALKLFFSFVTLIVFGFISTATTASTISSRETCSLSYASTTAAYATATDARYDEMGQSIKDGKPFPPASRITIGLWENALRLSLLQAELCVDKSDWRIRATAYHNAAAISNSLKKFADAKKYADICVTQDRLNSSCFLQLAFAARDMGLVRTANEAQDEGFRVAKVVVDQATVALFNLQQRLQSVQLSAEKQELANQISNLQVDIGSASKVIQTITTLREIYPL